MVLFNIKILAVSGSTLTFSAAPPTGTKVECITFSNVSIATFQDADNDTKIQVEESTDEDTIRMDIAGTEVLTLTNSAMTLKGTTPTLTIGDAGAEDTKIVFDGNAQDYYIGLDDSADDLVIGKGSTVGTTPAIEINDSLNVQCNNNVLVGAADSGKLFFLTSSGFSPRIQGNTNDLSFYTNNSERMRITSSGNLLVGTTTAINSSHTILKDGGVPLHIKRTTDASASNSLLLGYGTGGSTANVSIRGDGDLENTNNSYGALSDERLKSNIVDANSQLEDIKKVKVRNYTLDSTGETHIGVIAQELEESGMGGLVEEREEGYKGVKYSILYMKAIKAIQEQQEQIEALQSEINTLKGGE